MVSIELPQAPFRSVSTCSPRLRKDFGHYPLVFKNVILFDLRPRLGRFRHVTALACLSKFSFGRTKLRLAFFQGLLPPVSRRRRFLAKGLSDVSIQRSESSLLHRRNGALQNGINLLNGSRFFASKRVSWLTSVPSRNHAARNQGHCQQTEPSHAGRNRHLAHVPRFIGISEV